MSYNNGGKGEKAASCFHLWIFWLQGGGLLYCWEWMLCYFEISKQEEGKQFNFLFPCLQIWELCLIGPLDSETD